MWRLDNTATYFTVPIRHWAVPENKRTFQTDGQAFDLSLPFRIPLAQFGFCPSDFSLQTDDFMFRVPSIF